MEDDTEGDEVDRDSDGFVIETIVGGNESYRDFTGLQANALTLTGWTWFHHSIPRADWKT